MFIQFDSEPILGSNLPSIVTNDRSISYNGAFPCDT